VRVALEHAAVHEGAGVAFVGVADDEFPGALRLLHRAPLQPGGIAGPSASAQPALRDLPDHVRRAHVGDGLLQPFVRTARHTRLDALGVGLARVVEHDLDLLREEGLLALHAQRLHRPSADEMLAHDGGGVSLLHVRVQAGPVLAAHLHERAGVARSEAAGSEDLHAILEAGVRHPLLQRGPRLRRSRRQASGGGAHGHATRLGFTGHGRPSISASARGPP
jgi:hypothetical protein